MTPAPMWGMLMKHLDTGLEQALPWLLWLLWKWNSRWRISLCISAFQINKLILKWVEIVEELGYDDLIINKNKTKQNFAGCHQPLHQFTKHQLKVEKLRKLPFILCYYKRRHLGGTGETAVVSSIGVAARSVWGPQPSLLATFLLILITQGSLEQRKSTWASSNEPLDVSVNILTSV